MRRLVIVEDDDLVRKSMALYFGRAGWTVDVATDLEQAFTCLALPFDVIVCDLHLSPLRGAEGLRVLEEARRRAPNSVFVLLSGDGTVEFHDVRPDAVLQKPVRLAQLDKAFAELLEARG